MAGCAPGRDPPISCSPDTATRQGAGVNTIDEMVVPDPQPGGPPVAERVRQPLWWLLPALIGLAVAGLGLNVTLPYYAIAPGDARRVDSLIKAPADRSFEATGTVEFVTVSLQRVKPLGAIQGWLDGDTDVVPEDRILGTTPPKRYREQNLQAMDDSKQSAIVAAFRALGLPVTEKGNGAEVVSVLEGGPAVGLLHPGDTINAVGEAPVRLLGEAIAAVQARRPGDRVLLQVTDAQGAARTVEVVLGADQGRPIVGVTLRTKNRDFDLPFEVSIDSGQVGGPSAGLAFTLGLIDKLSAGELTGGRKVAATGTIDVDGQVGDVGGVPQKTAAVIASGASVFLVPANEFDQARARAGNRLEVVKVTTLMDAISALGRLGGDVAALGPASTGTPG